jgi:hypothetical protein
VVRHVIFRILLWPFAAIARGWTWMLTSSPLALRLPSWVGSVAAGVTAVCAAIGEVWAKQIAIGLFSLLFFGVKALLS